MVAAAATGLEPHMKDDGDGAGDGELTLLKTGYRECFFVVHLLWSQIPKQHSGVCSFHNTGIIDDDLVVVL